MIKKGKLQLKIRGINVWILINWEVFQLIQLRENG